MSKLISLSLACKLTLKDWELLTLGQIADIMIESANLYNGNTSNNNQEDKPTQRVATQADWDRFGG